MVGSAEMSGRVSRADELEAARSHGAVRAAAGRHSSPRWRRSTARPSRPRSTSTTRKGEIRIVLLKTVVDDGRGSGARDRARGGRASTTGFQVGDVMEEPVDFAVFGRAAVQAAKQRIIQRVREGERTKIRDEFATRVGDLLSGEVQQIERGKLVVMLNKFREAEAIIPYREQNHREHFHQGEPIRAVLKRVEETPKGPRLILSRADAAVRQGAVQARGARDPAEHRRDPRGRARSRQPHEDRRLLARRLDRSGRRMRRPQGLARAGGRQRARWRAHRHRARGRPIRSASPSSRSRRRKVARVFSDPATQDDPGRRRRGSALARDRPQRPERAPRVGAHRLEDRPLLEPRVAGAGGDEQLFAPLPGEARATMRPTCRSPSIDGHAAGDGGRARRRPAIAR